MTSPQPAPAPAPAPASTDPNHADALRWAERRLAMLQQLAALGMRLADEVVERAVDSPYHPETKHEPGRAFASVSRAVRLTLVLEKRFEADFFAVRGGEMPKPEAAAPCARASDPARDAEDAEPEDADAGGAETSARERTYESLVDREDHNALLTLPFDDCVDGIRRELRVAAQRGGVSDVVGMSGAEIEQPSSLPFMGRVETEQSEVQGGEVRIALNQRVRH